MQYSQFEIQVERLRKVYSPASLNEERVKVLWRRFKLVDNSQFEGAVDYLIGEFTTPALPSVSRFAEAVGMYRPSLRLNSTFPLEEADNPRAKELADLYVPRIKAMMRGFGKLPYDPSQRGEAENRPAQANLQAREKLREELDRSGEWK